MLSSTLIDELGYLSYANRHADLLFEIINRRYECKSTLVTTNRPFDEWDQVIALISMIEELRQGLLNTYQVEIEQYQNQQWIEHQKGNDDNLDLFDDNIEF